MAEKYHKIIAENRRAFFDYHILDTVKAGIVLSGNEVKSLRLGRAILKDSFGRVEKGELFLYNMQISAYERGRITAQQETRARKLLLNQSEMNKIVGRMSEKGLSLIPTKIYFDGDWVKVDLALGKPKKKFDKKAKLVKKDIEREVEREFKVRAR